MRKPTMMCPYCRRDVAIQQEAYTSVQSHLRELAHAFEQRGDLIELELAQSRRELARSETRNARLRNKVDTLERDLRERRVLDAADTRTLRQPTQLLRRSA